jgi:hypothetical protein
LEVFTEGRLMVKTSGKCAICSGEMKFRYKPMSEWNVQGEICSGCYGRKLTEHYIAPDRRDVTKK